MRKKKLTLAILAIWTSFHNGCAHSAPVEVKTYLYDSSTGRLFRRGEGGEEMLTPEQAHFYRCYSPEDDYVWRAMLAECHKE